MQGNIPEAHSQVFEQPFEEVRARAYGCSMGSKICSDSLRKCAVDFFSPIHNFPNCRGRCFARLCNSSLHRKILKTVK